MTRYRKRPLEIDAEQIQGEWFREDAPHDGRLPPLARDQRVFIDRAWRAVYIRTPEGTMRAGPGDWIVKGVEGELYAVKDSVFRKTYELAT